jgi:hypothetical protein
MLVVLMNSRFTRISDLRSSSASFLCIGDEDFIFNWKVSDFLRVMLNYFIEFDRFASSVLLRHMNRISRGISANFYLRILGRFCKKEPRFTNSSRVSWLSSKK